MAQLNIPFKIGNVFVPNRLVMAPLAGISDLPFRRLVKQSGCGLVYSEMISANGLVYGSSKTRRMLASRAEEKPLAVQIFGSDPQIMAAAAGMVEESGADILDINFGCSVKKVLKTGSGAALMREPALARQILEAVRQVVRMPVSIKMRSGWDKSGDQAKGLAQMAEACGIDAIAVHPRTAGQGFSGRAEWSVIAEIKKAASIPVIGNGDVTAPADAFEMVRQTGCDAVMIGRAAVGAPWIFTQILALCRGETAAPPDFGVRFEIMETYLTETIAWLGEKQGCRVLRSRLGWFAKGLPRASLFRESIKRISSENEAREKLADYAAVLTESGRGPESRSEGSRAFGLQLE